MKILLTVIVALFSSIQFMFAQVKPVQWNKQIHNFGRVQADVPVVYDFEFTNITDKPIRIESIIVSCSCIKPYWDNDFVKPNEVAKIRVTFREENDGLFKQQLKIAISDYAYPEIIEIYASIGMEFPKSPISTRPSISSAPSRPANLPIKPTKREPITPPSSTAANNNNNSSTASSNRPGRPGGIRQRPVNTTPIQQPPKASTNSTSVDFDKEALNTGRYAKYLTPEEKQMIIEVNKVRSDPKGYIPTVQTYINSLKGKKRIATEEEKKIIEEEIVSANELIGVLRVTPKLSILRPHKNLQRAAREHGLYLGRTANLTHSGSDGSTPLERIGSAAPELSEGAENLVANQPKIEDAVLTLLIDPGFSSRPHRKIMLNSKWEFIACFYIGDIGNLKHGWIQNLAKSRKLTVRPMSEATQPTKPASASTGMNVPGRPTARPRPSNSSGASSAAPGRPPSNGKSNSAPPGRRPNAVGTSNQKPVVTATVPSQVGSYNGADVTENISYLSPREKRMILEINYLRTQPKSYIGVVEDYIATIKQQMFNEPDNKDYYQAEIYAAAELIRELEVMNALPPLRPHEAVFQATHQHASDMRRTGNFNHLGSDNSYPWTRILRADPNLKDANENLVAGPEDIRKSLLFLLVDAGLPDRGHRKTILRSDWKYVICHEIGTIDKLPNCWIQSFAK